MMVWRRKSQNTLLIHSNQGSQFTSMDWASFLRHHNLVHSTFDYIEMFYNPTRKHVRNGMLSPVEFERRHQI